MTINSYDDLSPMHLDFLAEIGNIGSGNAASALSRFLNKIIDISVSKVRLLDHNEVLWHLGGPEQVAVGVLFNVFGEINGAIIYIISGDFTREVLHHFFQKDFERLVDIDDMDKSALTELGNIMASAYINAISDLTQLRADISVPHLEVDMVGALMSYPAVMFAELGDKILLIEDVIAHVDDAGNVVEDGTPVNSHMFLMPDVKSLNRLFEKMGLQ